MPHISDNGQHEELNARYAQVLRWLFCVRIQDILHDEYDVFYELCVHLSHYNLKGNVESLDYFLTNSKSYHFAAAMESFLLGFCIPVSQIYLIFLSLIHLIVIHLVSLQMYENEGQM